MDSPLIVDLSLNVDHDLTLWIYIPLLRKLIMTVDLIQGIYPPLIKKDLSTINSVSQHLYQALFHSAELL